MSLSRKLVAEWLGTALLVAVVIGSGIMGERLSGGSVGLALLANTMATGAILVVIILVFGNISGAHFNPAVTLVFLLRREIAAGEALLYVIAQVIGGVAGAAVAHIMFAEPLFSLSTTARTGLAQWVAEFVATFGLLATILGCLRTRPSAIPYAVGLFISAGYWFTSSTSFANPAVTIARALSDTFAGIAPTDAPAFIAAQLIGAATAMALFAWLWQESAAPAPEAETTTATPAE
jgi:glycerol uptake facilitator-like aquaporin